MHYDNTSFHTVAKNRLFKAPRNIDLMSHYFYSPDLSRNSFSQVNNKIRDQRFVIPEEYLLKHKWLVLAELCSE